MKLLESIDNNDKDVMLEGSLFLWRYFVERITNVCLHQIYFYHVILNRPSVTFNTIFQSVQENDAS